MLYKFCDTNEQPFYVSLPAEALSYNGKYIDEEIPLFRTLCVSGRESFSAELPPDEELPGFFLCVSSAEAESES